jgi:hypothetical protein
VLRRETPASADDDPVHAELRFAGAARQRNTPLAHGSSPLIDATMGGRLAPR